MKLMIRKVSALVLLVSSMATGVVAKPSLPPGPHGAFNREAREYMQTNVMPVLRQQRQQLEQELAPADRTQLATYRAQLKDLAQREQTLRQAARAAARLAAPDSGMHHRGRPAPTPDMQAARHKRREIMQQVAQLAQKYQSAISRLTTALQPQQTQWAADLHAIMEKKPASRANRAAGPATDT